MTTPPDYAPPIAITLGDAAGIGPEIIVKLCHAGLPFPCVVYGDAGILSATVKRLGLQGQIRIAAVAGPDDAVADGTVISERSAEHTSEIQSLMRISIAHFCL